MRRNARALIMITVLVVLALLALGFQTFNIGGLQRGEDTILGLSLGLDLQGGSHLVYEAQTVVDQITGEERPPDEEVMESLQRIIERRVNSSGLGEPIIQILGEDRLLVQLPGLRDPGRVKALIGETARLEFKHRQLNVPVDLAQTGEITPADIVSVTAGLEPVPEDEGEESSTEGETTTEGTEAEITGSAEPEIVLEEQGDPAPVLILEMTDAGAQKLDVVIARLNASLAQRTSSLQLPSRLEVSLEGNESLKYEVPGIFIQKIEDTNTYTIPIPDQDTDIGNTGATISLEQAQAIVGDNATISFIEIQGSVDEDFGLTGEQLARAYASLHHTSDQPIINLEFNNEGTRLFGELTTEIAGSPTDAIAIFLDENELIAPVVNQPITTGTAIIQGRDFTMERARDISLLLEGGRLPVPIQLIQERDVDAILGADSLAKSVVAGLVGLGLVFVFMTLYYRVPGLVAALALLIYALLVLAVFKVMPVTLTLSGVAAAILSVGMAVDANILIFERMKDELRNGRTLMSAINIGFNRAWPAIRDSNVSTLITCGILFYFSNQLGTTIVQGFAVTLAIGVLISMFSAIVVSRTILRVIASTPLARNLGVFVPSGGSDLPQQRQSASPAVQRS